MTENINRPAGDPRTLGERGGLDQPTPVTAPVPPVTSVPGAGPGPESSPPGRPASEDTKEAAKHEASQVADSAKESAQQVGQTAKREAQRTAGEAKRQVQNLLHQSRTELNDQAGTQQQRLAGGLRSFSSELGQMADGSEQEGIASHAARWAAEMSDDAGRWLEDRDPSDVFEDIKDFARRRPGMFVLIAAGAGLLVGRVARSLRDEAADDDSVGTRTPHGVAGAHRPDGIDLGDRRPPVPNPGPVPSAQRLPSSPEPQAPDQYPGGLR